MNPSTDPDRTLIEWAYFVPFCFDLIICSFTLGIFILVKAPKYLKEFRRLQIGIFICSAVLASLLTFSAPSIVYPSTIIFSSRLNRFNRKGLILGLGLYYALFLLDLVLHALVFMARVSAISPPLKKRLIQKMNYLFLTTIYVSVCALMCYGTYIFLNFPQTDQILTSHPSINLSMLWTGHSGTIIFTGFGFVICLSGCFMTSNIILVFKYSRFTIHLSQNTRLMHEQLTRVSFIQFTFLFFTCQLPFILAVVISASFGDNFGWLATSLGVLTNFHYSGNCLLVLAFTKFYREWLKNFFRSSRVNTRIKIESSIMVRRTPLHTSTSKPRRIDRNSQNKS